MLVPRFKNRHRLNRLTLELQELRGKVVEQEIYSTAKDEAMKEYVNSRISAWNSAIRASNGPKRGESSHDYKLRLLAANNVKPGDILIDK